MDDHAGVVDDARPAINDQTSTTIPENQATMRTPRILPLLLTGLAVLTLAIGCDSPKPKSAANKIQSRETIGKTTQEVRKLSEELQKGGVLASTSISVSDPLTQSAEAYRTSVGKIAAMQVQQAIQMRQASDILSDPKPLSYEEFMAEIIKKGQPDGMMLPMLPYYQEYAWDEQNQALVVVEYPEKKAQFEKQKPY